MDKKNKLVKKLECMSTATISDALFLMGYKRFTMKARIKPIAPEMRLAGQAFTVKAYPGGTYACELALGKVEKGQVLVIDGGGFLDAVLWGEIFSRMAMIKGVKGTVIDGAVRDVESIRKLRFPLFAAGVIPAAGTADRLGEIEIPISCGGVVVHPCDWVFGDILGVVVVPAELLEETEKHCQIVLDKEREIIKKLNGKLKMAVKNETNL